MKKLGFTLAELIMTLSIIGVTAAMIAPAVTNIVPDAKKAKVLKYNTQLNKIVNDLFNHKKICRQTVQEDPLTGVPEVTPRGIACVTNPATNSYINFDEYLSDELNLNGNRYQDNSTWTFNGTDENGYTVTIDTEPDRDGCSYSNACNEPRQIDTFIFRINQDGAVRAGDALTDAYLKNPLKLTNREEDLDKAAELVNEINYEN